MPIQVALKTVDVTAAIDFNAVVGKDWKNALDKDVLRDMTKDAARDLFTRRDLLVAHVAHALSGEPLLNLIGRVTCVRFPDTPGAEEWYLDYKSESDRGLFLLGVRFGEPTIRPLESALVQEMGFTFITGLPEEVPAEVLEGTGPLGVAARQMISALPANIMEQKRQVPALARDEPELSILPEDRTADGPDPAPEEVFGPVLARPGTPPAAAQTPAP